MSETQTSKAGGGVTLSACQSCGRRWQTPYPGCPYCGASAVSPLTVSGHGKVYSWVGIHRTVTEPVFPLPYVVVAVDLDGGGRIFAKFDGEGEPQEGMQVSCGRHEAAAGIHARPV